MMPVMLVMLVMLVMPSWRSMIDDRCSMIERI